MDIQAFILQTSVEWVNGRAEEENMKPWEAKFASIASLLLIGIFQCLSLLPGDIFMITSIQSERSCLEKPVGVIGKVYRAFGGKFAAQLGAPISLEKDFSSAMEIQCGVEQNKYQDFQRGSIYYDVAEKNAFVLFADLNVLYREKRTALGIPISSQIGSTAQGNCRGYFKSGFILCSTQPERLAVEIGFWNEISLEEITNRLTLPQLKMPFDSSFSGLMISGPHAWTAGLEYNTTYSSNQGSGLDFSGSMGSMQVLAMASGTVVEIFPDPLKFPKVDCSKDRSGEKGVSGMGCWVVVRNHMSGTVLIYGHIQPNALLYVGNWVEQGSLIGSTTTGKIGSSSGPHLHLEFRTGISRCWANCPGGEFLNNYGEPLDWHGVIIDGYMISAGRTKSGVGLNYDGTAVVINPVLYNPQHKYTQVELEKMWGGTSMYVYKTYHFLDKGDTTEKWMKTWLTRAASTTCDRLYQGRCDINPFYDGTVFAWGNVKSTNHLPTESIPPD